MARLPGRRDPPSRDRRAVPPVPQHADEPAPAGPLPTEGWAAPPLGRLLGPSPEVARALLGMAILRREAEGWTGGRIVETEAYAGPEDRASHARAGRTPRTAVMFGPAGRAYVYLVYGLHHCLNVVCGPEGRAGAVLIRALEPLAGLERMRARRGASAGPDARLAAGPARLCQALAIDRTLDGVDMLGDERLRLLAPPAHPSHDDARVIQAPRIGVAYAGPPWSAREWRFGLAGHPSLSRAFPAPG